jgi:hypothetical protein
MWRAIYHEFQRWAKASMGASTANRRTEITVETDRIWIIRKSRSSRVWWEQSSREVGTVIPSETGQLSGASQRLLPDPEHEQTQEEKNLKEKENEKR